ncbi:MAG: hypothetical protein ACFCVK_17210 [Acidimicrobiales bacterium]
MEAWQFDPFRGDDDLRRAHRALHRGEWDTVVDLVRPDRLGWILQETLTSEEAAVETVVFERLTARCDAAEAVSLLGGALVRDGWVLLAASVDDPGALDAAVARLEEAEATLRRAVLMRPALADPWVHLLSSGRALGLNLEELRGRFENLHSRVPFRPDGCRQYVLGLSARAGGVDSAMFDFARWLVREAPPGSPARVALPMAHLEHGLGPECQVSLTEHLTIPETVAELVTACDAFLARSPRRAGPEQLLTLNTFALALTVDDHETARLVTEVYARIDGRATAYPWTLYQDEDIMAVFHEVRETQLDNAVRHR